MALTQTHRTTQKHVKHKDSTDIQKHFYYFFFIFFYIFIYNFLNDLSIKCSVTALVRSMTFIVGLNQI